MSAKDRLLRWVVVGAWLSCSFGTAGCHKDDAATKTQQQKSIGQLGADDLRKTVESLGFVNVTATTSKSGGYANITVIGYKEHPEGEEGPDGKKRLRLLVSLHEDPEGGVNRTAGLAKLGAAYKRDERHTLSVELSNRDREEAKKILDKIAR